MMRCAARHPKCKGPVVYMRVAVVPGPPPLHQVLQAFFAKDQSLARLFLTGRAALLGRVWRRMAAWPPKPKDPQWPLLVAGYPMDVGYCFFLHDPPPPIAPRWTPTSTVPPEEERLWHETEFWCQQQVLPPSPSLTPRLPAPPTGLGPRGRPGFQLQGGGSIEAPKTEGGVAKRAQLTLGER